MDAQTLICFEPAFVHHDFSVACTKIAQEPCFDAYHNGVVRALTELAYEVGETFGHGAAEALLLRALSCTAGGISEHDQQIFRMEGVISSRA